MLKETRNLHPGDRILGCEIESVYTRGRRSFVTLTDGVTIPARASEKFEVA